MKIIRTALFTKDYKRFPQKTKNKVVKALAFIKRDSLHPSLRVKKMKPKKCGIWEARVDRFYRFTFQKEGDTIILRRVGPHDKVLKKP